MLTAKASFFLELVVDYRVHLIPSAKLAQLEEFLDLYIISDNDYELLKVDVYNAILEILNTPDIFAARSFLDSLAPKVQLLILQRLTFFEEHLVSSGNELLTLPNPGVDLHLYGLIDLWNEKQTLSSRYRLN